MTNAIDLQLIADYGGTMLWPMIALSNIAQGSAVLGMIALQKKNANAQAITQYITSNEAETSYQISDTGSITIYGLTESDEYTVTETDANKDGYTTTIDGETTATGTKTGTTKEDGTVVQYVNEKDAAVVTGVAKKYTPYVLLVGAAGALGSVFFRRKRA